MTFDPDNLNEEDKKIIRAGILQGLADANAGRVEELNENLIIELKARLRMRLANKNQQIIR